MEIIRDDVTLAVLTGMSEDTFGDLVKAVIDVERGVRAIGAELHADEEAGLIEDGSQQAHLWGISLYPAEFGGPSFLEFDSMINVRPRQGNRSRSVEDPAIRDQITRLVGQLVRP